MLSSECGLDSSLLLGNSGKWEGVSDLTGRCEHRKGKLTFREMSSGTADTIVEPLSDIRHISLSTLSILESFGQ